ncbi:MAG: hypothetical protein P1S46_08065 [bacterium]|nr:hypothetical protein [bacterium]
MPTGTHEQPKKHLCSRCGKKIVGVIPKWDGEKPVCRECAFAGPVKVPFPRRRRPKKESGAKPKGRKPLSISPLAIGAGVLVILGILFLWTSRIPFGSLDYLDITYEGDAELDRDGRQCVANLMVMSKYLSEGAISWPTRLCPATGKAYKVSREPGEVVIVCPNPGKHGLSRLWVSLGTPVVQVKK